MERAARSGECQSAKARFTGAAQYSAIKAAYGKPTAPNMFVNRGKPLDKTICVGNDQAICGEGGVKDISPHTLRH
jgi:hypothetical protein